MGRHRRRGGPRYAANRCLCLTDSWPRQRAGGRPTPASSSVPRPPPQIPIPLLFPRGTIQIYQSCPAESSKDGIIWRFISLPHKLILFCFCFCSTTPVLLDSTRPSRLIPFSTSLFFFLLYSCMIGEFWSQIYV